MCLWCVELSSYCLEAICSWGLCPGSLDSSDRLLLFFCPRHWHLRIAGFSNTSLEYVMHKENSANSTATMHALGLSPYTACFPFSPLGAFWDLFLFQKIIKLTFNWQHQYISIIYYDDNPFPSPSFSPSKSPAIESLFASYLFFYLDVIIF